VTDGETAIASRPRRVATQSRHNEASFVRPLIAASLHSSQ